MALTELTTITGVGIHTQSNINSHNINSTGIITTTKFVRCRWSYDLHVSIFKPAGL